MRDPVDALSAFFFSRRAVGVLMLAALLGASVALEGCSPEPAAAEAKPAPLGRTVTTAPAPGAVRTFTVRYPSGGEGTIYIITQPETGCEFLMTSAEDLEPNMARTRNGTIFHAGCRLGAYEDLQR
ncbi:hypothetical protein MARCHEWKA_02410 [Brevundimonas phage vB_BpoS-Marchewka]|uniref:Uncharacterized protein n=1 Tax=Brevundimonas phage vB_BpoS-Marchewka TaxID=2948604 RepID=A0A9E7N4P8_9CAUD|nr:hypothetical protein MARCHEWKA_02410 [Brevundimonas phage vB_BpoS-Marchewka]UTC29200.1 hypothetical protein BAMBUS_01180 [Brevundimonas phage vB_BpoS-Bambus]